MIQVLLTVMLMIHLVACFWYLIAKFDDFDEDTWVVRMNMQDDDNFTLYITSIYWTVQTITTVGFGDIPAVTVMEKIIAIGWMIVGVGFYSFTNGNLSSIMAQMDIKA